MSNRSYTCFAKVSPGRCPRNLPSLNFLTSGELGSHSAVLLSHGANLKTCSQSASNILPSSW